MAINWSDPAAVAGAYPDPAAYSQESAGARSEQAGEREPGALRGPCVPLPARLRYPAGAGRGVGLDFSRLVVLASSFFAVLGVAMVAQWSILSNITASITIFFAFPYKIGDRIRILDKDDSVTGVITEIGLFYVRVRDDNGDLVTYPANLILQKPVRKLEGKVAEPLQPE